MKIAAFVAASGLALFAAACSKPAENTPGTGTSNAAQFKACMVTDTGGIDDHSFNASTWACFQKAKQADSSINASYVASTTMADYAPNLTNQVASGCQYVQAVGGLMGDATYAAAKANPKLQFSIVDSGNGDNTNVYPVQFETQQAAYLAGYLAAGSSKSGKVGTYGGMKIAPVTIFMDGFADGVAKYNEVHKTKVQVLGWDKTKQDGLFTQDFVKQDAGKAKSDALAAQGADVIMPVAGGAGLGTAANAAGKYSVIWVDADGCQTTQYCSVIMTTVVKNMTDLVAQAVGKAAKQPGTLLDNTGAKGTLANNGVSLAPYHEFDSKIDPALKAEIDKLKQDIIAGTIKVESPAAPK